MLFAQSKADTLPYSSLRQKKIFLPKSNDTLTIDSLSILSNSFKIAEVDSSHYLLFPDKGILVWKSNERPDSITLTYRVFPFSLSKKYQHKGSSTMDTEIVFRNYVYTEDSALRTGFVDFNALEYAGSYGRSLAIGNNQNLSLNSNFNLQMNGYILDSVRVEAALTDNNIPFQPDGNTQQIQEFDKLYITFEKGNHKLTAGDYTLERPNSYFVNFNKRVQGLYYQGEAPNNENVINKIGLSASIAKGQYARNIFQGIEGNQGPYKLTGNNGEQFFIVLANSERVYIDGMPMERGEDRDYIINYNTAELTFMPRKMITKDSRIQVEFEYQDRNYLNSLFYVYDELQIGKKWNLRFNAYSNQDSKNQNYLQNLNGEQKRFLADIGDDINNAFYTTIIEDTFAANKILYKIIDTTVNGILYDSVFVFSTNPDSAKYNVSFSFVGPGKGDYNISGMNSNGRSYIWVAPVNGASQGSYAPLSMLITPKKHQMFSLGSTYKIDSLKQVNIELSASNFDPNLFSSKNNNQHWGFAGKGSYSELRLLGKKDSLGKQNINWKNELSYEYVQGRYKAISPYRNTEFNRDWNVDSAAALQLQDEQLVSYNTALNKNHLGNVSYQLTYYSRGAHFKANRHIANLQYDRKTVRAGALFNVMFSKSAKERSSFYRPSFFIEKDFKKLMNLTLGSRYQIEHNSILELVSEQLKPQSFSFDVLSFYLKSPEENKVHLALAYTTRSDKGVDSNEFSKINRSHNIETSIKINQWKNQQIAFTGNYRNLVVYDSTRSQEVAGKTVLGRVEYNANIFNSFLVPTLLYEAGSGQQQKMQFTYVEVAAGQGVYFWNDYNGDGVQQSNEFEIAIYPDQKKFVRIITPTNEYVKVNFANFNFSLQFNPGNAFKRKSLVGISKFISRFTNQFSVQISNKVLAQEGFKAYNPFSYNFDDDNIITNSTSISNTVYFNRSSAKWGIDYTFIKTTGKNLLTYGLESSSYQRNLLKWRWNLNKSFTAALQGQTGFRAYKSGVLNDNRTYNIQNKMVEPSLTWILKSKVRITASYEYSKRQNIWSDTANLAHVQSGKIDMRFSFPNYGSIQARGTFAAIDYNGSANTPISYMMLDALQKGQNWLWGISWDRRLGKGIELSLEYEGRAPGTNPLVHTGRMSIRAML